jgi:hypothetical protein
LATTPPRSHSWRSETVGDARENGRRRAIGDWPVPEDQWDSDRLTVKNMMLCCHFLKQLTEESFQQTMFVNCRQIYAPTLPALQDIALSEDKEEDRSSTGLCDRDIATRLHFGARDGNEVGHDLIELNE